MSVINYIDNQCRLDFVKDAVDVDRSPTAIASTLYVSSSPRVAAACRGRVTQVQVLYKDLNENVEEGLLAELAIAVYTPSGTGLERSSNFVELTPGAGVLNSSDVMPVQATFSLSRDPELVVEQGQTVGVLVGSRRNGRSRVEYPLLGGESEGTQAVSGLSVYALKQLDLISNQQGDLSPLPAFSFQIESGMWHYRQCTYEHACIENIYTYNVS